MVTIVGLLQKIGNGLFQIAAAASVALRNKDKFLMPQWKYVKYFRPMEPYHGEQIDYIYHQKEFNYYPIPYEPNMGITTVEGLENGYFQSEKYFFDPENYPDYRTEIRELLFPICEKTFPFTKEITCSVHVRRGDYCWQQNAFPLLSIDYYRQSIMSLKIIEPKVKFIVFSDDINWCKNNLIKLDNCIFIEGNTDGEDFCWMCQCTHNIIANSTFSWWGAWLNKNKEKIVYFPSTWFGPALAHLDTRDVIPQDWKKEKNAGNKILEELIKTANINKIFDEKYYLTSNIDVKNAVINGSFRSGYEHYLKHGQYENRNIKWIPKF